MFVLQMGLFSQVVVSYVSSTGDLFVLRETPQQKVIESLIALLRFGAEPCPQVSHTDKERDQKKATACQFASFPQT